jgi:hypothetical protein
LKKYARPLAGSVVARHPGGSGAAVFGVFAGGAGRVVAASTGRSHCVRRSALL